VAGRGEQFADRAEVTLVSHHIGKPTWERLGRNVIRRRCLDLGR
jgi:hypothetical protein